MYSPNNTGRLIGNKRENANQSQSAELTSRSDKEDHATSRFLHPKESDDGRDGSHSVLTDVEFERLFRWQTARTPQCQSLTYLVQNDFRDSRDLEKVGTRRNGETTEHLSEECPTRDFRTSPIDTFETVPDGTPVDHRFLELDRVHDV